MLRSFRQRIFVTLLAVALVPAAAGVGAGILTLHEIGSTVGTLGPWDAVAASGRALIEAARDAAPDDPTVAAASEAHRQALSESVRWSRLWAFVTGRFLSVLPFLGLATGLAAVLLSLLAARRLSVGFSRPIRELVGWTEGIARGEAPPPPDAEEAVRGMDEFRALRAALRSMAADLEEARERDIRSAHLRAWNDMARRVAHELKNPLTPMRIAAGDLARRRDRRDAETGRVLLEEITKLDEMARTFAQFGRMPEGPASDIDVVELLEGLARRHARPRVDVVLEAARDLPLVRGHYDVLERAFRNILVNAQEAAVSGAGAHGDAPAVRILVDRTDGRVRIRIRDRGPGIPPEILDTIWMPDVTTKHRGTGLGLAIVRQAVEVHGGDAVARNRPTGEGGAEIEVVLPALDTAPAPETPP